MQPSSVVVDTARTASLVEKVRGVRLPERSVAEAARFEPAESPALQPCDILPIELYARVRATFRTQDLERKRRRRVHCGPQVSILFESRETVLFHIHEIVWLERPLRPERIAEEIAEYERLVPRDGELTATLMIHGGSQDAARELLANLGAERASVFLQIDARTFAAEHLAEQPDPACPVQYIRFPLDPLAMFALRDAKRSAQLGIRNGNSVEFVPLPIATREELVRDLFKANFGLP